jgi:hypothetical protein
MIKLVGDVTTCLICLCHLSKSFFIVYGFTFADSLAKICQQHHSIDERIMKMIKKWYIGETHFLLESLRIKKLLKKNWSASALFSRFHLCNIYQCIQNLLSIWQNIPCCCDEAAMEVMWGVENLLHILVPNEETELREEDRKLRSQGLHMFLQSLRYNIEKELVSKNTCLY